LESCTTNSSTNSRDDNSTNPQWADFAFPESPTFDQLRLKLLKLQQRKAAMDGAFGTYIQDLCCQMMEISSEGALLRKVQS
jgi:hypothetical protein